MLSGLQQSVVVVVSSFYTAALEQPFLQALAERGDNRRVICVPYNQLHAFLLDPHSLIPEETPATVIFLFRAEDLIRLELAGKRSDREACVRTFRERTAQFLDVLSQIPEVRLTLLNCPCGRGAYDVSFLGNALRVAEYRTVAELRRKRRHNVVLWSDFEAASTTASIFNVAGDRLGHVPYMPEALEALADFFVQQIDALPTTVLKGRSREGGNATLHDFLGSLGVELTASPATPQDEDAAIALIRHTTHFVNIPDRKWTVGDFGAITTGLSRGASWIFRVRDRFGDYGISGAAVLNFEAGTMRVPVWFLTCPVLGKQVEHALMDWMANLAQWHGATSIEVPFVKGRDNQVQYTFLSQMDGRIATDGDLIPQEHVFCLAVAGLKERVARSATNPSAMAEISSRMHICGIDIRMSA